MDKREQLDALVHSGVSRRQFARGAVATGLWAVGASVFGGTGNVDAQTLTDADILNFALNLEYLEAEFYTIATMGKRITDLGIGTAGTGAPGATSGGAAVNFTSTRVQTVAWHVTLDEQQHVTYLRQALGSAAVAKPAINLNALGIGFANQNEFLTLARAFEDVGVSAYGGAAALIQNKATLTAATRIALTEAQHASTLRLLVSDAQVVVPAVDDLDVLPLPSPNGRVFQVDGSGLSTVRTASQVLAIVYGNRNANANAGGFFPSGVNGTITRV